MHDTCNHHESQHENRAHLIHTTSLHKSPNPPPCHSNPHHPIIVCLAHNFHFTRDSSHTITSLIRTPQITSSYEPSRPPRRYRSKPKHHAEPHAEPHHPTTPALARVTLKTPLQKPLARSDRVTPSLPLLLARLASDARVGYYCVPAYTAAALSFIFNGLCPDLRHSVGCFERECRKAALAARVRKRMSFVAGG